jgi:hypothetical protein
MKRVAREKLTIHRIIMMYQRYCLKAIAEREHYQGLNGYANRRLDKCVFGDDKPASRNCPVHCYQAAKREELKEIMRWAGPRMFWQTSCPAHSSHGGYKTFGVRASRSISPKNRFVGNAFLNPRW